MSISVKSLPVSIIEQYYFRLLPKCIFGRTGLPLARAPFLQVSEKRAFSLTHL